MLLSTLQRPFPLKKAYLLGDTRGLVNWAPTISFLSISGDWSFRIPQGLDDLVPNTTFSSLA